MARWGVGNPVLHELVLGLGTCDWRLLAMVARAAFAEVLWRWRSSGLWWVGDSGGGGLRKFVTGKFFVRTAWGREKCCCRNFTSGEFFFLPPPPAIRCFMAPRLCSKFDGR